MLRTPLAQPGLVDWFCEQGYILLLIWLPVVGILYYIQKAKTDVLTALGQLGLSLAVYTILTAGLWWSETGGLKGYFVVWLFLLFVLPLCMAVGRRK